MTRRAVGAALLVFALGTGACASGVSTEEFVKKADVACAGSNATLSGLAAPADMKQLQDSAQKIGSAATTQATDVDSLEKPKKDKPQVDKVVTATRATSLAATKIETAAGTGDGLALQQGATEIQAQAVTADDSARAYGFAECGKGIRGAATTVSDATKVILHQELIKKADLLCADNNHKSDAVKEPQDDKDVVRYLDELLALNDKLVVDLGALFVPTADKAGFDEVLAGNAKAVAVARQLKGRGAAGDQAKLEQLGEELARVGAESNKRADAFGFKDCGTPTQT